MTTFTPCSNCTQMASGGVLGLWFLVVGHMLWTTCFGNCHPLIIYKSECKCMGICVNKCECKWRCFFLLLKLDFSWFLNVKTWLYICVYISIIHKSNPQRRRWNRGVTLIRYYRIKLCKKTRSDFVLNFPFQWTYISHDMIIQKHISHKH